MKRIFTLHRSSLVVTATPLWRMRASMQRAARASDYGRPVFWQTVRILGAARRLDPLSTEPWIS